MISRDENNKDTLQLCGFYHFLAVSQACSQWVPVQSSEQGRSEGMKESTGRSLCRLPRSQVMDSILSFHIAGGD